MGYETPMPSATSLAKAPSNNRRRRPAGSGGSQSRTLFWLWISAIPAAVLILLALIFPEVWNSGALGMLVKGGFFMWPILLLGVAATAVCIERYRSLKMLDTSAEQLRQQVIDLLSDNQIEQALELCDRSRGPVAAVLANGLRKYLVLQRLDYDAARTEEQVVKSMENYGVHIVAALERHLPILATVSSSAPMLGFLGTVQGMIIAFGNIVSQSGKANIVELAASGIERALLTTCFGLIVGIPAFIAFNYFTSIINQFVLEVETSASELIEAVTLQMTLSSRTPQPKP